ncbi:hypothetical protein DV738_g5670, partial [Chaetothyriales sp. CBS 135597]
MDNPTNNSSRAKRDGYGETDLRPSQASNHTNRRTQTLLTFSTPGKLSTRRPPVVDRRPPVNAAARRDPQRDGLAKIAAETLQLLPGLLATRPDVGQHARLFRAGDVELTPSSISPKLGGTRVRVISSDTIDAALALTIPGHSNQPVCILNMANEIHAGGGFKRGALAQEEALCYRSSLFFTLKTNFYPIPSKAAIYSPQVLVFRESMKDGHDLMDLREPSKLPVISVISVAAICRPELLTAPDGRRVYRVAKDKELMMEKMRVILRVANRSHHRRLVLGAFGCGAFANPPEEVADMWASVLQESEFQAGWWDHLVFAVLDGGGSNNFRVFKQTLDGLSV